MGVVIDVKSVGNTSFVWVYYTLLM